jgi:nuclear GTP-binding protein
MRELQSVALERGLRIFDSPGVVFDDADLAPDGHKTGVRASSVLLRNVVRVEDVPDPVEIVEAILERTPAERVQTIYGVPPFADARELLTMLALTFGRLLKACALRCPTRPKVHSVNVPRFAECSANATMAFNVLHTIL